MFSITRTWILRLVFTLVSATVYQVAAFGGQPGATKKTSANQNQAWQGWGGPNGNFRLDETTGLIDNFGDKFPKRIWKRELGDGYSTILAKGGRLFTQYRVHDREIVVALDAKTGQDLWKKEVAVTYYDNMDLNYGKGPNASPLILDNRLFTVTIDGQMHAWDLDSGAMVWQLNLHQRYGRQHRKEEYGFSATPVAHGGRIILLVGRRQTWRGGLKPK